jgi:8-oxo-dGTP pyrophosphatase MutT (NUDIX family)
VEAPWSAPRCPADGSRPAPGPFLDPQVVPADRHRRAARVVLVDRDRVLLEHVRVAGDAGQGSWWELPGGGLEPGEDTAAAATRELLEETGYLDVAMGRPVATLRIRYRTSHRVVEQHETIHVARLRSQHRVEPRLEPAEAEGLQALAWLTLAQVTDGRRLVLPHLRGLVAEVLADPLVPRRLGDHDVTGWSDAHPDPVPIVHDGATPRLVAAPNALHDAARADAIAERPDDGLVSAGRGWWGERRDGVLVVRDAAPWTGAVHRRLAQLRAAGNDRVPEPLGIDAHGREAVRLLPGDRPDR